MRVLALLALMIAVPMTSGPVEAWELRPGGGAAQSLSSPVRSASAMPRERIESSAFRLAVPFRTQKDGSRWQGSNCGPAILGMVLDGFGQQGQSTDDLRFRSHTYQGTVGMRTGTALDHIAHVAEDFGMQTHGLYGAGGQWRSWTADDIREQLRLGRPVMPLVRLYLLPGYESSLPRWGHYVLITGMTDEGFFYSDPLQVDVLNGTGGYMSATQLLAAMRASHIPGQAVAFDGPVALTWQTMQ